MGYEVHFRNIPKETLDKYNKKNKGYYGFSPNNEARLSLIAYILNEPPKKDDDSVKDIKSGVFNIKILLASLEAKINEEEEQFVYDRYQEDNCLWYCGWQFSHDYCEHDAKEIYDYVIERLTLLKYCTTTGDYFAEHNNFQEKLNDIKDVLDYFDDMMREIKIYAIMDELKEYRVPDDEDDEQESYTQGPVSSFGEVMAKHLEDPAEIKTTEEDNTKE